MSLLWLLALRHQISWLILVIGRVGHISSLQWILISILPNCIPLWESVHLEFSFSYYFRGWLFILWYLDKKLEFQAISFLLDYGDEQNWCISCSWFDWKIKNMISKQELATSNFARFFPWWAFIETIILIGHNTQTMGGKKRKTK